MSQAATTEATALLDSAIDAVDDASPARARPTSSGPRPQLLERAKELDIEGRSGLDKRQLIAALRAA